MIYQEAFKKAMPFISEQSFIATKYYFGDGYFFCKESDVDEVIKIILDIHYSFEKLNNLLVSYEEAKKRGELLNF